MGRRRKNRLSSIIRYELICLAAVSLIVFGAVRWSEGIRDAAQTEAKPESPAGRATGAPSVPGEPEAGRQAGEDGTGSPEPEGDSPEGGAVTPEGSPGPANDAGPAQGEIATPVPEQQPEGNGIAAGQDSFNEAGVTPAGNPDMDMEFIRSLAEPQPGEILEAAGAVRTVYYLQHDARWGSLIYGGEDTLAKYACGPTSMAIVVSSLTDIGIDPVQMSQWAYDNGYWYDKSGSLHSIVNGTAKAFGLESEGVGNDSETSAKVIENLEAGGMAVVLMGKGHFTKSGHFIVLRGITPEGKILVADCNSRDNTMEEWDMETIREEAKYAADGGPFWNIWVPNTIE